MKYYLTEKRYPYFPAVPVKERTTLFQSIQVDCPNIYENYGGADRVLVIDGIYGVEYLFKDSLSEVRSKIYKMLSGDVENSQDLSELLLRFYKTEPAFSKFVDNKFIACDHESQLLKLIIDSIVPEIKQRLTHVYNYYKQNYGAKILIEETHFYSIIKVTSEPDVLLPGVTKLRRIEF